MTNQTMTDIDRVRAALAEAGYPNAHVWESAAHGVEVDLLPSPNGASEEACWMAFFICGMAETCWPCWSQGYDDMDCTHDPATEDRPSLRRN